VHAHWTYEFAWGALASKNALIVSAHDSPFTVLKFQPSAYRLIRLIMAIALSRRIRHLTAVSPYLAQKWRRQMLYRRPVAVVPNIAPFQTTPVARSIEGDDELRIVDIADGSSRKNVATLLAAFRIIRQYRPDATLVLMGAGLSRNDQLATAGPDGVSYMGRVSRETVARELSRATMFVHPALEESQPMCFLEAFAYQIPCIGGSGAGGVPWTLDHGKAGILVDVESAEEIARAVISLSKDPDRRRRIVEHANSLLASRYSREAITDAYVAVYRGVLEGA
jgi:glycosyltransferase involved in cell wall biosynthesis